MFRKSFVFTLIIVSILAVGVYGATAQEPQLAGNGGCEAGSEYDPNCDVNRDGDMTVEDLSLVANHWGQAGVWTAAGDFWQLGGNANITDPATQYLGTTDGKNLVINPNGGKVGIGTTSPGAGLDLARSSLIIRDSGGASPQIRIESQASVQPGGDENPLGPRIAGGESQLILSNAGADTIVLRSGRSNAPQTGSISIGQGTGPNPPTDPVEERVRLDSNGNSWFNGGNVGIGVTNPKHHLDIGSPNFGLQGGDSPNAGYVRFGDGTGWKLHFGRSQEAGGGTFNTGNTGVLMTMKDNGNVGIGAQDPQHHLDIGTPNFGLQGGASPNAGYIRFGDGTGWKLHFGRSQEVGGGTFNTGNTGVLMTIKDNGNVGIGTPDPGTKLHVEGQTKTKVLEITGGSDLAEPFEIAGTDNVEPGMVVAIDPAHPGQLRIADQAYDRTVAGCVSGAGGINPGMIMQQEGSVAAGSFPVALTGRVYCWADAAFGAIQPGDLLTTSDTPGHLMKAIDEKTPRGAIVGKAMSMLAEGKGLVLILVMPQ